MKFKLLKSTVDRENVGDVFIKADSIENIVIGHLVKENQYTLIIGTYSKEHFRALFSTLEEAKQAVRNILTESEFNDEDLNDLLPYIINHEHNDDCHPLLRILREARMEPQKH